MIFSTFFENFENPRIKMKSDIAVLHEKRPVEGLEFYFDSLLLRLRLYSPSYLLNYSRPKSKLLVDLICLVQFLVLLVVVFLSATSLTFAIAVFILYEIYLCLLNIVFIGKIREINAPPASIERSILLSLLNVLEVILAFGIFYKYWLELNTSDALYGAILVLGTIGTPLDFDLMPWKGRLLVGAQVFMNLFLIVLILGSFIGQVGLFRDPRPPISPDGT
jgi:hypothetical protein